MIHVIAEVLVKSGQRDQLLAEIQSILADVRQEYGCIEYGPAVDAETEIVRQATNPDMVTMIESWESLEALEAHLVAPHMLDYREKVKDLVIDVRLRILRPA